MASAITLLPGQIPPGAGEINEQPNIVPLAVSSTSTAANSQSSSGSIGPFFGVISVLAVLAILSCILGRVFSRHRAEGVAGAPFESIKHRRYFRWMKWKNRWCCGGDVEVGANVMAISKEKQDKVGDVHQQTAQP